MDLDKFSGMAALNVIWEQKAKSCKACRLGKQRRHEYPIFGHGETESPKVVFVAEHPSGMDASDGYPFVEDSPPGQLLDVMIEKMGLTRGEIFLTFSALCGPPAPGKRVLPDYREACEPLLLAQIRAVRPAVVVALGETAGRSVTGLRPPQSGTWYPLNQGRAKSQVRAQVMVTRSIQDMFHEDDQRKVAARAETWKHLQMVMGKLPKDKKADEYPF